MSAIRFRRHGGIAATVPGSPRTRSATPERNSTPPLHPAALLFASVLVGVGLALGRSAVDLAVVAAVAAAFALRAEGRTLRAEAPLLSLAFIVFAAHTIFSGTPISKAVYPAAMIALRLLALLYLLRWAARAFLGDAARWLLSFPVPARPRILLLLAESARHTLALTPLALREAELQHMALRARGLRPGMSLTARARYLAAWLLPFLGTMLRLGMSYGDAVAARGYLLGRRRRSGLQLSWRWHEAATVVGGAASAAWLLRGI